MAPAAPMPANDAPAHGSAGTRAHYLARRVLPAAALVGALTLGVAGCAHRTSGTVEGKAFIPGFRYTTIDTVYRRSCSVTLKRRTCISVPTGRRRVMHIEPPDYELDLRHGKTTETVHVGAADWGDARLHHYWSGDAW